MDSLGMPGSLEKPIDAPVTPDAKLEDIAAMEQTTRDRLAKFQKAVEGGAQ